MKNAKIKCIIDTLSVVIEYSNVNDITIPADMRYFITNEVDKVEEATKRIKINPHLYNKGIYEPVYSLKVLKNIISEVLEKLSVINQEDIKLNRIDIAIDNDKDFDDNFKMFLFFFDLYTFEQKKPEKFYKADRWYTTDMDTLKRTSIKCLNRSVELVIYDKEAESEGKHEFNTRMEFRFKRVKKMDYEKHLKKINESLDAMSDNLKPLEEDMSKRLVKLWAREWKTKKVKSFSEFVRKYSDYFYTVNIMKAVYKESGLKGSYSNWIREFRKTHENFEFYSNSTINTLKSTLKRSVKDYIKS